MAELVAPHGGKGLVCALLEGASKEAEIKKAAGMKRIDVSDRAKGDLIMMGIGGFSPLTGFMGKADWKGVCENFQMADKTFFPVPITLDIDQATADSIGDGEEVALYTNGELMATMKVEEKFAMSEDDKKWECEKVFMGEGEESVDGNFWKIALEDHPGVIMVMAQKDVNIAGPVKVLSEGEYPAEYPGVYLKPAETRAMFEERGWSNVAALQLRNPMHRSHEYLGKIAIEVCDGVLIHSLIGNLKPGDIPAKTRVKAIEILIDKYFVRENIINAGYPLDMRYAGPREGLLHATFRQNYGVNNMLIGRDHAGVGDFYGLFEAQTIFDKIPTTGDDAKDLLCKPMKIDWTFYCTKCDGMASLRTCPHDKEFRVILSGTKLRKALSEGADIVDHFGREEVLDHLKVYYASLTEKVEVKMQGAASGDVM
ncbi:MAG: sulfate adenylyltransferase [Desulfobulbaceae bacterium]|jgi:sulfate adenylyltransferase|nr:sulfate adenylyltransferase [Desulfobulbaceae bacterium]